MSADSSGNYMSTAGFGLNLASREEMGGGFFVPFGNNSNSNKAANLSGTEAGSGAAAAGAGARCTSSAFFFSSRYDFTVFCKWVCRVCF